ncbi:conserved Plasmodium protein, unknown function [Plasmodium yoelii]|nr:conserved Plasmodium protein, unknown function [Plasmodium yoelii]CDU18911.1 conserved Plasmodium protein, unknown function [Plasmodium yoelii]VTZ79496.1 conserved Plasmodium protein, unknown function [Plasmodium yoelii]|eukprot:XP_022812404.1 conserved Plasmodium protein, unknown function [Plasmodium yoelii]
MNNVLFLYLSLFSYFCVASLCYQMIYVNFFDENKKNDLENISCYWQYFCHGNFHFCQYGCSLKKKLKKGYNLLNTNSLQENCFINIECDDYDIYFDSEDPAYIFFFSNTYFRITSDSTLYVNLYKGNQNKRNGPNKQTGKTQSSVKKDDYHKWNTKKKKKYTNVKIINKLKNFVSQRFKKELIKLLIFFIIIYLIFLLLFIYTYLQRKRCE